MTPEELGLAHSRQYVDDVLALRRPNGFGTWSRELADSLLYTSGAMLTAARWALADRTAVAAPCSGFHHAGWRSGGGFCTFNGLMVAALSLLASGEAGRVGILDCDNHYGDGTDDILERLGDPPNVVHRTAGRDFSSPDQVPAFFKWLDASLDEMADCDVVLYQAGADPHIDDSLGGWMTSEQMRLRDATVFDRLRAAWVPVAWNLAGGYQRDADGGITPVLRIHRATALEHCRVFG